MSKTGIVLATAMMAAIIGHSIVHVPTLVFCASAVALVLLSKYMGDATEHLSGFVGERAAGLMNVSFGNLAELIIIFVAVRENQIDLVQAGIIGSIIGNVLLTMGGSIYMGCRKNGTLHFNHDEAVLFIDQFLLVGTALFLPELFNGTIKSVSTTHLTYVLAVLLPFAYVYFFRLSFKDPRFAAIIRKPVPMDHLGLGWSKGHSITLLIAAAIGAFWMSELLVDEVQQVTMTLGVSRLFIGFIVLPLLGNIAERSIAIIAAQKKMTELSLAISIGSASQVGMIIAPAAVLFGVLTGNSVTFSFEAIPLKVLILSLIAGYLVLQDDRWNINEGITLLAIYGALALGFAFTG